MQNKLQRLSRRPRLVIFVAISRCSYFIDSFVAGFLHGPIILARRIQEKLLVIVLKGGLHSLCVIPVSARTGIAGAVYRQALSVRFLRTAKVSDVFEPGGRL